MRKLAIIIFAVLATTAGWSQEKKSDHKESTKIEKKSVENKDFARQKTGGKSDRVLKKVERGDYQEILGNLYDMRNKPEVDVYAMYPGGINGIQNHIIDKLTYPVEMRNKGIQGKVMLKFTVGTNGKVKDIEVLKSVCPELDSEAVKTLGKMKKWIPAYHHGEPVEVDYAFPFNFEIKEK